MKKAIIYGRTSTTKQSAESIETQIAECKKWAQNNDCIIVDIYDDSGQSGRAYNVNNRNGFQQIKEDAKNGKMDFALIHKIDRFARSVADYFIQERELEKYGVKIIVVGMPFFQNADIITKSVHIAMAEQFSVNLSNDVSVKMRTFAYKKAFLGGKAPYGYMVVENNKEKTLAINENEAHGVRLIYQLYLQGYGYIKISQLIAQKGYLNEKNEPFTPTHVRKILTSKKYNGWYVFGRRENINGKIRNTSDKDKLIEIPDAHPKIIDDITFQAVQNKIASKTPKNKRKSRYYPFTGLVTCGECGRSMTGQSTVNRNRKTNKYCYYKCNGYRVNGCKVPSVRAEYIEDYVANVIKKYIFNDDFINDLIQKIEHYMSIDIKSYLSVQDEIRTDLNRVNLQIKSAMKDKYRNAINEDLYNEVVDELNKEKQTLELRLAEITQQIHFENKSAEIKSFVEQLKNNINSSDEDIKNALLRQAVRSIVVTTDNIDVYFNITSLSVNTSHPYLRNINIGVPLAMISERLSIHTAQGFDLLRLSLGDVKSFNNP